jgi:hypothetical protein
MGHEQAMRYVSCSQVSAERTRILKLHPRLTNGLAAARTNKKKKKKEVISIEFLVFAAGKTWRCLYHRLAVDVPANSGSLSLIRSRSKQTRLAGIVTFDMRISRTSSAGQQPFRCIVSAAGVSEHLPSRLLNCIRASIVNQQCNSCRRFASVILCQK